MYIPKTDDKCDIINTIEVLRREMIQIGIKEGLTSERTIKLSQELDQYLLKIQIMDF